MGGGPVLCRIMDNQLEKTMEHEMEAIYVYVYRGVLYSL